MPLLLSLSFSSSLLVAVDSHFSSSSLFLRFFFFSTGVVYAHVLFSFFFFFFFFFYNANIMSADRQSTTTRFTQLKESNGSSGNISNQNRRNNDTDTVSLNLVWLFLLVCFALLTYPTSSNHPSIVLILLRQFKRKASLEKTSSNMMNIETLLQAAQILESQQSVPPKKRIARSKLDLILLTGKNHTCVMHMANHQSHR